MSDLLPRQIIYPLKISANGVVAGVGRSQSVSRSTGSTPLAEIFRGQII